MNRIMNYENLRRFAYVNDNVCARPVRGIVLSFFGLNCITMYAADTAEGEFYGEKGILYVVPYYNPWSWMNRQAVTYTDEILDVLFEKYDLDEKVPIVSTGGSMGGQGALVYPVYAKRTPVAAVTDCPVCDMLYHYHDAGHPELSRTFYSAVWNEAEDMETALKAISPLHLIDRLPRIPYHIFHCDEDKAVSIRQHSDKFVKEMKEHGFDITYDVVPGRGHCSLTYRMKLKYAGYILEAVGQGE